MNTPSGLRWFHHLLLALGIFGGIVAWKVVSHERRAQSRPPDPMRVQAWERIAVRLQQAEKGDADLSAKYAQRLSAFFAEKQRNTVPFAEDVTGWGGKWEFVKSKFVNDNGNAYLAFLRDTFQRHFFSEQELKEHVVVTITAYLSELEGRENALLVEVRTDLGAQDLPEWRSLASPKTGEAFQKEYRRMIEQVVPTVSNDLKISLGREAVVWIGSDVATAVTMRIGSAVATQLGVSSGILGSGAASGVATFGVGLIVGFVVDAAVDRLMRQAGYDPTGQIARQASGALSRVEDLLLNGDGEARQVGLHLRQLQAHDRIEFVREECGRSADRIDATGTLGLRHELNRLYQLRGRLRESALKKLVLEGGRS